MSEYVRQRFSGLFVVLVSVAAMVLPHENAEGGPGARRDAAVSPEAAYWPAKEKRDLSLPMPCGMEMVLRYVCTPSSTLFEDDHFRTSCGRECGDNTSLFINGFRQEAISGPFVVGDLPGRWQETIKADPRCDTSVTRRGRAPSTARIYLIGKFEVTERQWQSVMGGGVCQDPLTLGQTRPQVGISWFEAVDFTRKYTQWLLENKPEALPVFPGASAFIRLPTEMEWEYAARGGQEAVINPDEYAFPRDGNGSPATLKEFVQTQAVTAANGISADLSPIASKAPNPLGLYDIFGNAAEMIMEPFRYSVASRSHGAAGGFVLKGGSYVSQAPKQILPGWRDEVPFYDERGPFSRGDMGLRIVVAAHLLAKDRSGEDRRQDERRVAWDYLISNVTGGKAIDRGIDVERAVDKLIAESEDEVQKKNLAYLKDVISNNNSVLREKEEEAAKGLIRTALFLLDSIDGYVLMVKNAEVDKRESEKLLTKYKGTQHEQTIRDSLKTYSGAIRDTNSSIENIAMFYTEVLEKVFLLPEDIRSSQLGSARREFEKRGYLGARIKRQLGKLDQHLKEIDSRRGYLNP